MQCVSYTDTSMISIIINLQPQIYFSPLSATVNLFMNYLFILRLCVYECVCVWGGFVHTCVYYRGTTQAAVFFELINMLVLSSEACSDLHFHTTDHKSDERAYCAIKTYVNDYESSTQPKLHLIWSDMIWYDMIINLKRKEWNMKEWFLLII